MTNQRFLPSALVAVAMLTGCNTLPASDSPLAQAHNDYNAAQADPQVPSLAGGELKQASDSLDKADLAFKKDEKRAVIDHLAYVAKQQVAIARETARQKAAELAVADASAERDRLRLAARTREADSARRNAEAAQRSAEAAQRQSEASQRQSEASQRDAEAAQRQAMAERQAANDAQLSAQAARQQTLDAESRANRMEEQLKAMEGRKTDRGMNDEKPDDKRQQTEGRQIEMKAAGEAIQIAGLTRLDAPQAITHNFLKRLAATDILRSDQQPRDLTGHFQDRLRGADIDEQDARSKLILQSERRKRHPAFNEGR